MNERLPGDFTLEPGETKLSEYSNLFDGWDQPTGVHKAAYIMSCIGAVTFEDGTVWNNPGLNEWREAYEGKKIDVHS